MSWGFRISVKRILNSSAESDKGGSLGKEANVTRQRDGWEAGMTHGRAAASGGGVELRRGMKPTAKLTSMTIQKIQKAGECGSWKLTR